MSTRIAGLLFGLTLANVGSGTVAFGDSTPAAVSIDILRHPISAKVKHLLAEAMRRMDAGEHETAISELKGMLTKHPESAPYAELLLGAEYVKTEQFDAAVKAFEVAAMWLPHDAMTRYNLGLAVLCTGDYPRAEQEVRRALELDPTNERIRKRLPVLRLLSCSAN